MDPDSGIADGADPPTGDGDGAGGEGDGDIDSRDGRAVDSSDPSGAPNPSADCGTQAPPVDTLDLLVVMDNSGSMGFLQEALRAQIPRMLEALAAGDLDGDGEPDFTPVRDFHLGVVTSDMGLVGVHGIVGCDGFGDDGVLRTDSMLAGFRVPEDFVFKPDCQPATYPSFLGFAPDDEDLSTAAQGFGCLSRQGVEGCGFAQPLEAMLKALWPSVDVDPATGAAREPNRVTFLGDMTGAGRLGHGDVENAGFLRLDPRPGRSLLAVLLVTDGEDCSSRDTGHFIPPVALQPDDPLRQQDLNLRCFYNQDNLYAVERYADGLRSLRHGAEHLVVFGAIAGVPSELVDASARAGVDFEDAGARDAYYRGILEAQAMQEVVDDSAAMGARTLVPSCRPDFDRDGAPDGVAFPPRRIVELVRQLGPQGVLGSSCQGDLSDPIDGFLATVARTLDGATDPGIPGVCDPYLPSTTPPTSEPAQAMPMGMPMPMQGPTPTPTPPAMPVSPGPSSVPPPPPPMPTCTGAPPPCGSKGDSTACNRLSGCTWLAEDGRCNGMAQACDSITTGNGCLDQEGCFWR